MDGTMADVLENFYQEVNVYKALIITIDDQETLQLVRELSERNHSVTYIHQEMLEDERDTTLILDRINSFKDTTRIFVVSYSIWYYLYDLVETHVLPEQNLIAFGSLEDNVVRFVVQMVLQSKERGFVPHDVQILRLREEESDSDE